MNKLSAWMFRLCSHSLCSYSSGNPRQPWSPGVASGVCVSCRMQSIPLRCATEGQHLHKHFRQFQLRARTPEHNLGLIFSQQRWRNSKNPGVVGPCTPVSTFLIQCILYFFMLVNHWHSKGFPTENLSMPQNLREFAQIRSRLNPRENNISTFYCNASTLELPHENSFLAK